MKTWILFIFTTLLLGSSCLAQVRQQHVSFYGGDLSGQSYASLLKTDKQGNYFAAGKSQGLNSKFDYALVKYSANGNVLWERRYNGEGNGDDEPFGLLIDNAGNSYITGISLTKNEKKISESVTIKYDPDGQVIWINKYKNSNTLSSCGHSISVDQQDNIYLAGYTGNEGSKDILLLKISNKGETLWDRSFDANTFSADYTGVIYLHKEHIYLCGSAFVNSVNYLDFIVLKYDVNGNLLWSRSHNGDMNGKDIARSIFVDKSENIYVTGYTENRETKLDITTIKYNYDGEVIWVNNFNGTGNGFDWPNHVIVDDDGNVYVEGGTQNERETNPDCDADLGKCRNDATLIKYLSTGVMHWVRLYNGADNMYDCLQAMVLDKDNNIYVAGRSHCEPATTDDDIITMKFNSSGEKLWFMKYNSGPSKQDYGNAIALDDFGNVFTSGWSNARGLYDFVIIKYSPFDLRDHQTESLNLDNYPNPFNPTTKISFTLDLPSFIKLRIYDVRGREISVLANELMGSGSHSFNFDASALNSGVYFYKLEAEGTDRNKFIMTKKMILLK